MVENRRESMAIEKWIWKEEKREHVVEETGDRKPEIHKIGIKGDHVKGSKARENETNNKQISAASALSKADCDKLKVIDYILRKIIFEID